MIPVLVAAVCLGQMVYTSVQAQARYADKARLPMSFAPNGTVLWWAPRALALWFMPGLAAIIVLPMLVMTLYEPDTFGGLLVACFSMIGGQAFYHLLISLTV